MATMKVGTSKSLPLLRIEPFLGIDVSGSETQIDNHHSPDMLNMNIDSKGALNKRVGYSRVFSTSLGDGGVNGLFNYQKSDGSSIFLIAHGTKLYTQSGDTQPVQIYDGLKNQKVHFFINNNKCYILDGANFLVYNGTTVSAITPYVPTIQMSKPPKGGGTAYEDFNLINNKFKDSFSGTGSDTVFQLSLTGLDDTAVSAVVGTSTINEGSGLTVDRINGKVTFTTAPESGTNNVIITAGKTVSGYPERVKNCTFSIGYGGSNDTRTFIAGNPNMGEYVFRSGLMDPTYWPENGYYKFVDKVMGFSKQYDYLIIERLSGKNQVTFSLSSDGTISFPSKPINDEIGCMAHGSIQIIDNNPVSLSDDGIYAITATNVKDERNVVHISQNIDKRLLLETNLADAISIDFDKKYWLAINNNVYILDYTLKTTANPYGEWILYDHIPASCFLEMGGFLYFGSKTDGIVYRFKKEYDSEAYNDDGETINAYWRSKSFNFSADEMKKYVDSLYFALKPASRTSMDLYYTSDKKENVLINANKTLQFNLFDFGDIDFDEFTFYFSTFPKETKIKVKAKQITHFQLIIQNNKLDESLTVLSMGIDYRYQSKVR